MCGIAGVIGAKDSGAASASVKTMMAVLARRGPDSEGIASWDGAVLGHRRLAIFDLSDAGKQPMVTLDGTVGVVFNGAIYNFRELRDELLASGYKFASHTDTEVLLHGYVSWGLDRLVHRLRGMFAFALWDDRTRRLYLVRDRLGVKPLVYTVQQGAIAFASTVRALSVSGLTGDLDEDSVREFLLSGFLADDRAIYKGVRKVPAASIVEWSEDRHLVRRYWEPRIEVTPTTISFHEAVEKTRSLLLDSVKVRLHADVQVGALLSGGIDSSLVCWAVQELRGDVKAFTVATPGDPLDETEDATDTARRLGLAHTVVELSPTDLSDVTEVVSAYAEPFGSSSALGMLRVSRAISSTSSAKVLLTGDGGDEAFLGYPWHRHMWIASNIARYLPEDAGTAWGRTIGRWIPRIGPARRAAALLEYATGGLSAVIQYRAKADTEEASKIFGERFAAAQVNLSARRLPKSGRTVLSDLLRYALNSEFVGEYLPKVDGATMHHGIEARSPFLDHRLWEFAGHLPYAVRLHRGRLKAVLRQLVHQEIGAAVARRRKRGFGIPVQRWIATRWRSSVEAILRDSLLEKEGWIRRGSAITRLDAVPVEGLAPVQLWYLVVLESWLRHERQVVADTRSLSLQL
jgi:asparagine synthase (glutamine-hydrolysing)